jgi:hypothetical protein
MWGAVGLRTGETREYTLGDLHVQLRRRSEEVWLRSTHAPPEERGRGKASEAGGAPEDWIRWAVSAEEDLELEPRLPDRPVVVSPEQPFFLPPEGRARVYVRIPLFVSVATTGEVSEPTVLEEFASLVLSDTWWGSFTEGELAYWLETRARREIPTGLEDAHMAVCPLLLVNRSEEPLEVERFAVRVAYLTLLHREDEIWTDEVQVRYRGGHEGSEIRYTGGVPEEVGPVEALAKSREPAPRGLRSRTFGRLAARVGTL